jgi:3-oxoacyl-[acyl-carrier protein] reductase
LSESARTLDGRVALVTGGGTGLGQAVALRLAASGAAVAVNYASSADEAHQTVADIEQRGGTAFAVHADVSDERSVEAMTQAVHDRLGPIDVLVANAGITEYVPFAELERVDAGSWERIQRVNVLGTFLTARAASRQMSAARGGGRIVIVSSNSAFTADGSSIPYVVSKAALVSLAQCLARALAPTTTVNTVAPGWMLTPWVEKYLPADAADAMRDADALTVDAEDVAEAVAGLLCNPAITGQAVVVDRGDMWLGAR